MFEAARFQPPRSVLIFSPDPVAQGYFWAGMLGTAEVYRNPQISWVMLGDFEIAFCPPDTRNSSGGSPAIYFWVDAFNETRFHLREWGCLELHYPMENPDGTQMTQFEDPYGTIFGIRGLVTDTDPVWPDANLEGL